MRTHGEVGSSGDSRFAKTARKEEVWGVKRQRGQSGSDNAGILLSQKKQRRQGDCAESVKGDFDAVGEKADVKRRLGSLLVRDTRC